MGTLPQLSIIKGKHQNLMPKQLNRIFEENLQHHLNELAIIYNDTEIRQINQHTYSQMNSRANQIARCLVAIGRDYGYKPNSDGDLIIAVCMQPSATLVTTLMGIWKAGASYLPIEPSFPNNRIEHILREAKPVLVIRDDNVCESRFKQTPTCCISDLYMKSGELASINLEHFEMLDDGSQNLAIVLYTSGSTGVPKGVRLPHKVILNRLQWQWSKFPYLENETVGVFKTSLTFVDSIAELWGPLLSGLAILVLPKSITQNPERLVNELEEFKICRLVLVPTLLRSILMYLSMKDNGKERKNKLLYNLQIWVCSGEPLPTALAMNFFEYFQEGFHTLFNFYGSTEVMGDISYFMCESKMQLCMYERIPIGIPVYNTVIYILDSDYRPVKNGEIGEIFVSGLNLAHGYVDGRDANRFLENPLAVEQNYSRLYRTGDYGSIYKGNVMYEGRQDSQIKIRGHRIDLSEIEKNILDLEIVEKAIVLCYHSGQIDQALLAFVKLSDNSPLLNGLQLEMKLRDKLTDYMTPQITIIDNVPLLVNGKVDRQALLKSYETANNNDGDTSVVIDYDYSDVPKAMQEAAKQLFEIIGSVIGRSIRNTLSIHSNFYELGGNSLNSIFTVTLLRERGFNIGISEFISAKTLGEVLEKLTSNHDRDSPMEEEWIHMCPNLDMEALPLTELHKNDVIEIITDSFYNKSDLEQWLKPDIQPNDYKEIVISMWDDLIKKGLSFVIRDRNINRIIGAALNFDILDEPELVINSKLAIVFDFLEYIEKPIRENYLPTELNKTLHSLMMGTSKLLQTQENIACIHFMENEILLLAKENHFTGIMTTNTSPLTQQLGNDVNNYKTLLDYQINKYVYKDGLRPFGMAPDDQRAIVHFKKISN